MVKAQQKYPPKSKLRKYVDDLGKGIRGLEQDLSELRKARDTLWMKTKANHNPTIHRKTIKKERPNSRNGQKSLLPSLSTIFVTPVPKF